jgi:polysaccharide biosynthesis protein PslJ
MAARAVGRTTRWAPEISLRHRSWGGGRVLRVGWPVVALFLGLPLWWALGTSAFIAPVLALPLALVLVEQRPISAPRGFGIWVLFLGWMLVTATQVHGLRDWAAFSYRSLGYVAATIVFLFLLNVPPDLLPTRRVINVMAGFWGLTVAGGLVGVFLPAVSFATPTELVLPSGLVEDRFINDMVHASTSSAKLFAAYPVHRPSAPFPYSNMWGATYALSLPFAAAAFGAVRRRATRVILISLLVVSVVPLVLSLGRGAWLSIVLAAAYGLFRLMEGRRARGVLGVILALLLLASLLVMTPLGDIISTRAEAGYSDESRLNLYTESLRLAQASPLFGHGTPVDIPGSPSAGTHGQFWTVLVSHGFLGTLLFVGWLLWAWFRSGRRLWTGKRGGPNVRLWCHLVISIAIVQLPVYALLPWGMLIVMTAAAVFWREALWGDQETHALLGHTEPSAASVHPSLRASHPPAWRL